MSLPAGSITPKRLRIISLDGGPSTPMMLQILRRLETQFPGFLTRADMFSGTSDGAFASLFLARNLDGSQDGKDVIWDCIQFESKLIATFKLTLTGVLRIGFFGLLSMFDGSGLSGVLSQAFGDSQLKHLHKKVSIEAYDAWARQTVTFHQSNAPDMLLVDAALASAAFMPMAPAFRRISSNAQWNRTVDKATLENPDIDKSANLMLDGAYASNSPILPAIADALHSLWREDGHDMSGDEPAMSADGSLHRISLISMGCNVERVKLLQRLFSIKWPPLGLQASPELFQYGPLWSLVSGVQGLASTMIQRQAKDECRFARQLLGCQRFHRFAPDEAGAFTLLDLMWDPEKFIQEAERMAEKVWHGKQGEALRNWVKNFWMQDPTSDVQERPWA